MTTLRSRRGLAAGLAAFAIVLVMLAAVFSPWSNRAAAQVPQTNKQITITAWQFQPTDNTTGYALTGAPSGFVRQIMITPRATNTSTSIQIRSAAGTAGYDVAAGAMVILPAWGAASNIFIKVGSTGDGVDCMTWVEQ